MGSQKIIAEKLNLSQATVSRALRDDNALPLSTRISVRKAAEHLGYVTRRYKTKNKKENNIENSKELLVLIAQPTPINNKTKHGSAKLEIIQGLLQAANETKINLIVKELESFDELKNIINDYCNRVFGAIMLQRFPVTHIDFCSSKLSCVSINYAYDELPIVLIDSQQEKSFFDLTKYLIKKGHRNIGFCTIKNSNTFFFKRYSGYLRGIYESNLMFDSDFCINVNNNEQLDFNDVVEKIRHLIQEKEVTAFVCSSGSFAKDIIIALEKLGIECPRDVSFASFDEVVSHSISGHLLCGYEADYEKMGNLAISILHSPQMYANVGVFSCNAIFYPGNTVAECIK